MKNRYFIKTSIAIMAVTFLISCQNEGENNNYAKDKMESLKTKKMIEDI